MKNLARGFAVLACLGTTASALPQLRVGESAELFLIATAGVRVDDNVLLSDGNELSDTIFEVAPGLEFTFGQGSRTTGTIRAIETLTHYLDNDDLNAELFSGEFGTVYDDGKLKLGVDAAYRQLKQNTRDVRGPAPVRRDVINAGVDTEIHVTEKTGTGLSLTYDDINYKEPGYIDSTELAIPFNYFYEISPKVDVSVGLRYRETSLDGGVGDSTDYYYNVGARGDFSPKLSGRFSVGYAQRKLESGRDESSFGAEGEFKYLLTEKTALRFAVSNDFTTSAEGTSQKTFNVSPSLVTKFSSQWEGSVGVTYQQIAYFPSRDDEYIDANFGLGYRVSENVRFAAAYNYRVNDSNVVGADFDNNVFSLTAVLRF